VTAKREDLLIPAWTHDRLGCDRPPEIEASYFDPDLHAWVLSRHVDLLAAFRDPSLVVGRRDLASFSLESEEIVRLNMREEVRNALCPVRLRPWLDELEAESDALCRKLQTIEPLDLVADYGRPLCLRFAALVTGISQTDAETLERLAQTVSEATADPGDSVLSAQAEHANKTLRGHFSAGPESLRDSGFVGLSQTLLRIVSASWYALIQFPDQWKVLRGSPQSLDQAMEELLRYAGVIRILWRTATKDVDLNGTSIRQGDHVVLRVFAGSHDPERFEEPEKLDCARRDRHHFAFGAGVHACVAANLNRMAAVTMTAPLLARFASVKLSQRVEWHGGSIMRSPASLWVVVSQG
jgi:hypothetical protein